MKQCIALLALVAAAFTTTTHAADCAAMAAERKISGAAKISFLKKCEAENTGTAPTVYKAGNRSPENCEKQANEKRLSGI
ncbi:MAG: hypothetical protein EOO77_45855, partial [Oxalobacteraceae bacterium]